VTDTDTATTADPTRPPLLLELTPEEVRVTVGDYGCTLTDEDLTAAIAEVTTTSRFRFALELLLGAWDEVCRQVAVRAGELAAPASAAERTVGDQPPPF
jgi:hypothetical protein